MSLKPCPECGHQVSNKALACPKCGCPLAEDPVLAYAERRINLREKAVIGMLIIAAVFTLLGLVDREFLYLAFGSWATGLLTLVGAHFRRALLEKSKLKP